MQVKSTFTLASLFRLGGCRLGQTRLYLTCPTGFPKYENDHRTDMARHQHTRVFIFCFHPLTNAWNLKGNYSKNCSPPLPSFPSSNPVLAKPEVHSLSQCFFPGSLIWPSRWEQYPGGSALSLSLWKWPQGPGGLEWRVRPRVQVKMYISCSNRMRGDGLESHSSCPDSSLTSSLLLLFLDLHILFI